MSEGRIGQGPGNLVPNSTVSQYLAGGTITRGQVVALETAQGSASYSVVPSDVDAAATANVVGVAKEAAADGDWFDVYVKGYCPYMLCDGSVTIDTMVIPDATAGYATDVVADHEHKVFGVALATDAGAGTAVAAMLFGRFI